MFNFLSFNIQHKSIYLCSHCCNKWLLRLDLKLFKCTLFGKLMEESLNHCSKIEFNLSVYFPNLHSHQTQLKFSKFNFIDILISFRCQTWSIFNRINSFCNGWNCCHIDREMIVPWWFCYCNLMRRWGFSKMNWPYESSKIEEFERKMENIFSSMCVVNE